LFNVLIDGSTNSQILFVFAKEKDVDYLLIARPVAFNQSGIHHDCAVSFMI
jgi:hypothetical protein